MKIRKILYSILILITFVLELLPYGTVLNFATPEESRRVTYSYFSITTFGYANFGPLLTAILTCILIVLIIVGLFKLNKKLNLIITITSTIAVITSLLPLLYGIEYFTLIGMFISILLASIFAASILKVENKFSS